MTMMMMMMMMMMREDDEMLMWDQTTEQEKVLLQIRNGFFWYKKVQVSVRIWSSTTRCAVLADIRDRKERGQGQCMRIHPRYRKKHGFCRMFSWLRLYTGPEVWKSKNCQAALQMVVCKKTKKWCTKMVYWEKNTHFYENYQKKRGKVLRRSWSSTHHGTEARPAFELNRSARMMWCISFSRTGGGLFKGILLKR